MRIYILLAVIVGLSFHSCKEKDEGASPSTNPTSSTDPYLLNIPDTLVSDYLPAYPGSYWRYEDGNGAILEDRADSSYVLSKNYKDRNNYPNLPKGSSKDPYTANYVPFVRSQLLDIEAALWDYGFFVFDYIRGHSNLGKMEYYTILNPGNSVGVSWIAKNTSHVSGFAESKIIVKDTAMTVNGTSYQNVIGVQEELPSFSNIPHFNLYFAKDVGIILKEELDSAGAITNSWFLAQYFINK